MPRYIIIPPRSKFNSEDEIMRQYGATWSLTMVDGFHWVVDCSEETLMIIVMKTGFTWEEELWHKQ